MIIYDDGDEEEVFYKVEHHERAAVIVLTDVYRHQELLSIRQSHVVRSKAKENSSNQQSISPASTRKVPFANVSNQSCTPARLRKVGLPDFLSGYASDECISTAAVDLGQRPQKKMRR